MTTKSKAPKKEAKAKSPNRIGKDGRVIREYTFHLDQETLSEMLILCPLSIKQEKYLNDTTNDIVVWGGAASAGKTQLSLIRLLLGGMWDADYVGGIARSSQRQMKMAGSLWHSGVSLFSHFGINSNRMELSWTFPNKAAVSCHHLYDNQEDWHGSQMTECLVDEGQQCKEDDVWFLTSRLRSKSKQKHQLRITCNPSPTSFLRHWLQKAGYVGEDGFPVKEMDGVTTFMLQSEGEFKWWRTIEEVEKAVGKEQAKFAQKFVFYSATVYDNPYVQRHLPEYVHKLENAKPADRAKYLLGNWIIADEGDGYIDREWFKKCEWKDVPLHGIEARCWDFAATKPHAGNKNPDWTRGTKATFCRESGSMYITSVVGCRDTAAVAERLMMDTAIADGTDCYVGVPMDAGAAGKQVAEMKKAKLTVYGMKVITNRTRGSKLQRAEGFLIALQEGNVFVAPNVFTEDIYKELENFDGNKNNGFKDDVLDTLADLWNLFTSNKLVPTIKMGVGVINTNNYKRLGGSTFLT